MTESIKGMVEKKTREILEKLKNENDEQKKMKIFDEYLAHQLKEKFKPTEIIMKLSQNRKDEIIN